MSAAAVTVDWVRGLIPRQQPRPPLTDPNNRAAELAVTCGHAADLTGVFSLFALISVLALAAGAKQLPLPLANPVRADDVLFTLYVPWLIPFVIGAIGLWIMNRHWLRMALALGWDTPVSKAFVLGVGAVIAGAVVTLSTQLQDDGRAQDARAGAIVEQRADAQRAQTQAVLDLDREELARLTDSSNQSYQAQAARDGAIAWAERITIAREQGDSQMEAIERAIVSAKRADALRVSIQVRTAELAAAPVHAETARRVEYDRGALAWTSDLYSIVPVWLALSIEAIALVMKFLETVFMRKAWSAQQAAEQDAAPSPPPDVVLIPLPDLRDQSAVAPRTNERGGITREHSTIRGAA